MLELARYFTGSKNIVKILQSAILICETPSFWAFDIGGFWIQFTPLDSSHWELSNVFFRVKNDPILRKLRNGFVNDSKFTTIDTRITTDYLRDHGYSWGMANTWISGGGVMVVPAPRPDHRKVCPQKQIINTIYLIMLLFCTSNPNLSCGRKPDTKTTPNRFMS